MFDHSKRSFLKSFLIETLSIAEELRGIPQYRIDELVNVPDEIFKNMVPVFHGNKPSRVEDGWILLKDDSSEELRRYYKFKNHEENIFRCFDGNHSISGICNFLQAEFGLNSEETYEQTRSLFIYLAQAGLCHPAGGHERQIC